ncbi:uncharacterized protein LOC110640488 isoform X4 [Hevea brasiliensis]|uniref:uncharacterized protein LOC110640488 isoform X4 n=1 Tax=Hevea brasiliensis TaxID=3981 RepID=UPI0025D96149|nr:uncharacterized protein LOC110640488 isoform X4 [Hevea brasiliensis]
MALNGSLWGNCLQLHQTFLAGILQLGRVHQSCQTHILMEEKWPPPRIPGQKSDHRRRRRLSIADIPGHIQGGRLIYRDCLLCQFLSWLPLPRTVMKTIKPTCPSPFQTEKWCSHSPLKPHRDDGILQIPVAMFKYS